MKLAVPTTVGNFETRASEAKGGARPARLSAFGPEVPRHFFWLCDILGLVAACRATGFAPREVPPAHRPTPVTRLRACSHHDIRQP